jgi:hypothetical protein
MHDLLRRIECVAETAGRFMLDGSPEARCQLYECLERLRLAAKSLRIDIVGIEMQARELSR